MANAAILGYGTVGSGVYEIIKKNSELIKNNALDNEIKVTRENGKVTVGFSDDAYFIAGN